MEKTTYVLEAFQLTEYFMFYYLHLIRSTFVSKRQLHALSFASWNNICLTMMPGCSKCAGPSTALSIPFDCRCTSETSSIETGFATIISTEHTCWKATYRQSGTQHVGKHCSFICAGPFGSCTHNLQ